MASYGTEQILISALMHNPKYLLQKDKYQLETSEFSCKVYQYIFFAIASMAPTATKSITIPEIEQFLKDSQKASAVYESQATRQALIDGNELEPGAFETSYRRFKKENLLEELKKEGIDTSSYEKDELNDENDVDKMGKTADDIIDDIEKKLLVLKTKYTKGDTSETKTIFDGMEEMLVGLEESPEIGLPLQGKLFNHIVSGALPGRFYLRSGSSGLGKTRSLMADACYLAFPLRFNWRKKQWEQIGYGEKVLVIITEQDFHEVQKMALAYITGINESVIKRSQCNEEQKKVLAQALKIFEKYQDNFLVIRVPNPSITLIKQLIREQVSLHDIMYVFYDYIFISPSLLSEFKGMQLRNDEILLMFSDALKQLAVELDVFVMSSTQVNAKADESKDIRNEASLAGSRAVINKADMGCIMARPTTEELKLLDDVITETRKEPNIVTDIYKLRGGEFTQTRIWSQMDLGTLRKEDLFVTNARLESVDIQYENVNVELAEELTENTISFLTDLNNELKGKV